MHVSRRAPAGAAADAELTLAVLHSCSVFKGRVETEVVSVSQRSRRLVDLSGLRDSGGGVDQFTSHLAPSVFMSTCFNSLKGKTISRSLL